MKHQKGQDMIEYALMLAIIVGIGWLIYASTGWEYISYLWHDTKIMISNFTGPQKDFPITNMWTFWGKH